MRYPNFQNVSASICGLFMLPEEVGQNGCEQSEEAIERDDVYCVPQRLCAGIHKDERKRTSVFLLPATPAKPRCASSNSQLVRQDTGIRQCLADV